MKSSVLATQAAQGTASGSKTDPVSVFQVQDEGTKEEDKALACSPIQITAERRRSLWYATHYPTDERKVSHDERDFRSLIFLFLYFTVEYEPYNIVYIISYSGCLQFIETVIQESQYQRGKLFPKKIPRSRQEHHFIFPCFLLKSPNLKKNVPIKK